MSGRGGGWGYRGGGRNAHSMYVCEKMRYFFGMFSGGVWGYFGFLTKGFELFLGFFFGILFAEVCGRCVEASLPPYLCLQLLCFRYFGGPVSVCEQQQLTTTTLHALRNNKGGKWGDFRCCRNRCVVRLGGTSECFDCVWGYGYEYSCWPIVIIVVININVINKD